jgi:hypothetical protein
MWEQGTFEAMSPCAMRCHRMAKLCSLGVARYVYRTADRRAICERVHERIAFSLTLSSFSFLPLKRQEASALVIWQKKTL